MRHWILIVLLFLAFLLSRIIALHLSSESFSAIVPVAVAASPQFNIDLLARAVAQAETSNCTAGVGLHRNNCFSINSKDGYLYFNTPADSYTAFKAMWLRVYGAHFPTWDDAKKYKCGPRNMDCIGVGPPNDWYRIVKYVYSKGE